MHIRRADIVDRIDNIDTHAAAACIFVDFNLQRCDQHKPAGEQVIAATDDEIRAFIREIERCLVGLVCIILAVAKCE